MGVCFELGPNNKLGQESIDFNDIFSLSSNLFIPVKNKKLTLRVSISTQNAKTYFPSISVGLLR
jgi:hypothetical protein